MRLNKTTLTRGMMGLMLVSGPAIASDIPVLSMNLCTLHYSKYAYDKPVKSVMAHTGVLKECSQNFAAEPVWTDIHDILLKADGDQNHFAGKIILKDKSSTYQSCKTAPIVQFWVTFDDDTVKIEQPVIMKLASSYFVEAESGNGEARKAVLEFGARDINSIETVGCINVNSYGDIAYRFLSSVDPSLFPDFF